MKKLSVLFIAGALLILIMALPMTSNAQDKSDGSGQYQYYDRTQSDYYGEKSLPDSSNNGHILFYSEPEAAFEAGNLREKWFRHRRVLHRFGRYRFASPVHNCDELATALKGRGIFFTMGITAQDDYETCFSVSLYGRALLPQTFMFDSDHVTREIFRHLNVGTVPWSLNRRLGKKGAYHFSEAPVTDVDLQIDRIDMLVDHRLFSIYVDAASDFLRNGRQQLLADWVENDLHTHEYHEGLMLLVRTRPGGPIVAQPIPLRRPPGFTPPPAPASKER